MRRTVLLGALAAGLVAAPVRAQETRSDTLFTVEKYLDYETVADPQISPDGSRIVYTRRWVDKLKDRWQTSLWIMDADGGHNRFLADGGGAVWAPDGKRIAYIAEGEPKGPQVWVKYVDLEGATQITHVDEAPGNLRWSSDGRSIGFTMFVPAKESASWKIDLPAPPEGATWTKAPRVVRRIHYRADRRGMLDPGYTHLFVVSADGGTPRDVTPGEWSVGARFDGQPGGVTWDWMPDGKAIVVEGLKVENADTIYRDAYVYRIDLASGEVKNLTPARGTWTSPAVSPDGRWIAYTGAPYSRMSYRAVDLYVMAADGSGARKLSEGFDRDPAGLVWAPDGKGIYFTAADHGTSNVYFAPLGGGVRPVTTGQHMLQLASLSRAGVAVGTRTDPKSPPDVVRFSLRQPQQLATLTHVNDDLLERIRLGDVERITYTSTGGAQIEGWIVKPPGFQPGRKYPLILEIHGGPHGMYNVGFNPSFQNFAANGFVVLYTNPRGSTGYGTAFGNAIERDYPGVDYEDLMAGVDAVIAKGYVDPDNMFVGGCSGGGVLSSWVIGHTDRFKAAAVRCPVIDWLSFAGQTDIPYFTYNFFDKPFWEDPTPWLKHSSLMYVGNVKTPTLLMTGVLDMRTPMPQTEEFFSALKMRGVPTTLLRFEGEYHGTGSRPSNWMRTQLYMMDWYRQWGTFAPKRTAER
ncbi:MAG: S9 family peptidase [Gemmatimonadetes bacterium]|nr:S9 family peptidase [Gemmatimonadota bacterium]